MSFPPVPKTIGEGGGARLYNVRFLCSKTIGVALGSVRFNTYERGDYRDA